MKKYIFLFIVCLAFQNTLSAQDEDVEYGGFAYGVKGGLTIGIQQWNSLERSPLFSYNGSVFMESVNDLGYYTELGIREKGSAIRTRNFGSNIEQRTYKFGFQNLSLIVGAKKGFPINEKFRGYYMVGVRADYTLDYQLDLYENIGDGVNRFNYGLSFGGGVDMPLGEFTDMRLDIQVSPDVSQQIDIAGIFYNRFSQQNEQISYQVSNTTVEISIGFRIKYLVIYE